MDIERICRTDLGDWAFAHIEKWADHPSGVSFQVRLYTGRGSGLVCAAAYMSNSLEEAMSAYIAYIAQHKEACGADMQD